MVTLISLGATTCTTSPPHSETSLAKMTGEEKTKALQENEVAEAKENEDDDATRRKGIGISRYNGRVNNDYQKRIEADTSPDADTAKQRLHILTRLTEVDALEIGGDPETILKHCQETADWNQAEITTANAKARYRVPIGYGVIVGGVMVNGVTALTMTSLFNDKTTRDYEGWGADWAELIGYGVGTVGVAVGASVLASGYMWAPNDARQADMAARSAAAQKAYGRILAAQTKAELETALRLAGEECYYTTSSITDAEIEKDLKSIRSEIEELSKRLPPKAAGAADAGPADADADADADAGPADAGPAAPDSGPADAGPADAGVPDAGSKKSR